MTKKRKRRVLGCGIPLAVVGLVALGLYIEARRIDDAAELFADTGKAALGLLGTYANAVGGLDRDGVLDCYDRDYASEREGDWAERLRSDRDGVSVYEWSEENQRPFTRQDVAERLAHYFDSIKSVEESKFKLAAVEDIPGRGAAVVRAVLWLRGTRASGATFECHAHFRLWLRADDDVWKIHKQELIDGETVTGDRGGFTDITASAGITFRARHNPLWKTPEWEPKTFGIIKYGSAGVSAVDYDNDGWYDLFFCDGQHPRLYHNNGDGTFTDVTAKAGLPAELCGCNVAIFADFNNDGYKDLFLGVGTGLNRLYKNNGDGTFTDVTEGAGLGGYWVTVAAAADYDNDGKVDLYLGRYLDPRKNLPTTLFYTRNGEGNTLLHNDGDFHFRDVTAAAGVREGGLTLGVAWGDYDNDGYPDLFVANDFGRNALFHNNGDGTFTDVSKQTGALDFGYSMSAAFGDINNDGHLDIYVSKVHSGQRWYGQAPSMHKYLLTSLRQGTLGEDWDSYSELYDLVGAEWHTFGDKVVRGNSLLLNDGRGHFRDVGEETRSNPFGWYWASAMFDYDNDGLQDIYAVNGWITGKTKEDLWLPYILGAVAHIKRYKTGEFFTDAYRGERSWNGNEHKVLLRNEGIGAGGLPRFTDVGMAAGADDVKDGRGLAIADFDNDGALDLAINNNPGDHGDATVPATLLHNNVGARRNWLAVELRGTTCNRDAIGAVVLAEIDPGHCGGKTYLAKQMRHVTAGSGYASQHGARLYFGLDDRPGVDKLTVRWPGGGTDTFTDVRARQLLRITQGKGIEYGPLPARRETERKATAAR